MIAAYPDGLKTKDKEGDVPLHIYVRNQASVDHIQQLLQGFPGGIILKNKLGKIPILDFIRNAAYHGLIIQLLKGDVSLADVVDGDNESTAKAALDNPRALPSAELMGMLVNANSRIWSVVASDGNCAFPLLCQHWDEYADICIDLINRQQSLASVHGRDGETALHKLMRPALDYNNPNRLRVMTKLISVNPAALSQKDHNSHTPISYLVVNSTRSPNIQVLRQLLGACPAAIKESLTSSHVTLLEIALNSHPMVFSELLAHGSNVHHIWEQASRNPAVSRILTSFQHTFTVHKKGGWMVSSKPRTLRLLLFASCCFYYKLPTDLEPEHCIGLRSASVDKKPHDGDTAFELTCHSTGERHVLHANSVEELNIIVNALHAAMTGEAATM